MYPSTYLFAICFLFTLPKEIFLENPVCDLSSLSNILKYIGNILNQALDLLREHPSFKDCRDEHQVLHPGPKDCRDVQNAGNTKSGLYRVWPLNWEIFGSLEVYCDMETDGGGWIVIQRRGNYGKPQDYFYKTWEEYQVGFGDLLKDFWLGNDKIFSFTNQGNYSLRVDMKDKEGERKYAFYRQFWIENEKHLYELHLSEYSGDAGDSLSSVSGMKFTTKDKDNDVYDKNCAHIFKGGWWYFACHASNLNGLYLDGPHESYADGIEWNAWKGLYYSLPEVEMKIRHI